MGTTYDEIAERAENLPNPFKLGGSRLVVHIQITEEAIDDFLAVVRQLAEEKKAAGFVRPTNGSNGQIRDIYVRRK